MTPRMTLTRSRSNARLVQAAGVLERPAGHQEAEQLGRVGRLDRVGGDPEFQQREIDRREKTAAMGVGPVGRLGVVVKIVRDSPVGIGHLGDRVDAVANIGPVTCKVLRLRKHASHSDDGHRNRGRGIGRIQVSTLSNVVGGRSTPRVRWRRMFATIVVC